MRFDQQINYASTSSPWTDLSFSDHFAASWTGASVDLQMFISQGFLIIAGHILFQNKFSKQVQVDDAVRLFIEQGLILASATCGSQTLTASLELVEGYHYFVPPDIACLL